MNVQLDKPELERFIVQEVEAGHFASPSAAIAAAI
jgi:Arc/MetJ-type ribon-helix-helix transcriptional regulator